MRCWNDSAKINFVTGEEIKDFLQVMWQLEIKVKQPAQLQCKHITAGGEQWSHNYLECNSYPGANVNNHESKTELGVKQFFHDPAQ